MQIMYDISVPFFERKVCIALMRNISQGSW